MSQKNKKLKKKKILLNLVHKMNSNRNLFGSLFSEKKMSNLNSRKLSNSSAQSFQLCPQMPLSDPIYCSLFEFLQGSQPRVVWRYGEMDQKTESNFVWYIMSVPTLIDTQDILPKPTFISSSFENYSFQAVYASIPDIEARGFSRSICLVIASKNTETIFSIKNLFVEEFGHVIDCARENAANLFLSEIDPHIEAIKAALQTPSKEQEQLSAKLDRLMELKEHFPMENAKLIPISKERCYNNALLFINNDLRKIEFIIDFSVLQNQIIAILRQMSLPNSILMSHILTPSYFSNIYVPSLNIPEDRSLIFLHKNGILKHALFSLLSGKTIILVCSNIESILPLSISLVELLPFRWEDDIYSFSNSIKIQDCLRYSVVTAPSIIEEKDNQNSKLVSIIDFNKGKYIGTKCPEKSTVSKFPFNPKNTEGIFWIRLNYNINLLKEKIERFAIIQLSRAPRSRRDVLSLFELIGLSGVDEPIFSFFMNSMNSSSCRPLILDSGKIVHDQIIVSF